MLNIPTPMRRLLREPLLHFFVLGALLFVLYGWLHRGALSAPGEIVVSRGQVQSLQAQFERIRQRPATPQELHGLVENWVREEIFYREGLAMGLDRDDPVVRRRIGQKMEFAIEGLTPTVPTTAELQAWLDAHPADYQVELKYSLRQVYFDPARHGEKLNVAIEAGRRALAGGKPFTGDQTMLPATLNAAAAFEVSRLFGNEFEDALRTLPVGGWQGPVRSGFGLHLIHLRAREGGQAATLQEVRAAVERDLLHARTRQASEDFYSKLRAGYEVRIEGADIAPVPAR